MPVNSFTSWLSQRPYGQDDPSAASVHYGPDTWSRDPLDAARMAQFTPEAQYPDGYLGTIRSRRDDRLLNAVKERQNARPYQRGVHKGERVSPSDYFWDEAIISPDDGIMRGMDAVYDGNSFYVQRMAPLTGSGPVELVANGRMQNMPATVDMRPPWR
jgi:hypothetical protein